MKTVIFDIDGTLADITHRLHHVKNGNRRWDQFFAEADKDLVVQPIKELAQTLSDRLCKIILVSGRSDEIMAITEKWLKDNFIPYDEIHMRKAGDHRQDFIIKSEILDEILSRDHDIWFVVDDRPSVVKMWRERGLICLQCSEWNEVDKPEKFGLLTLMVGPTCAGKTSWLKKAFWAKTEIWPSKIHPSHVISSDQTREDICGDFKDQTKNEQVFKAIHEVVKIRLENGLPTVVDATNIKRADRLKVVELAKGNPVRYIVLDRPIEDKYRDAGWRGEVGFDLIKKHDDTFKSQLKDILKGDNQPNVTVVDARQYETPS